MRTISVGSYVFVIKQRQSRKFVRVEGRMGTALRITPQTSGEPDVLVEFEPEGMDGKCREWCWRDELDVVT